LAKERGQLVDAGSPSAEPFRTLRLAIELRPDSRTGNVIVFTSPHAKDGKSTIAANYALAASINAAISKPVLLIDADLRKPSIHDFFGLPRSPGLAEALRDDLSGGDLVHRVSPPSRLDVLTAGAQMLRAGDVAASPAMRQLIEQAREEYALIVVDSPPVLYAADAAGLASHDGTDVIMVVSRRGKRRALRNALRKLELIDANVLGLVVNREGRLSSYAY
jgi:protein-tyrosine kinase